MVPFSTCGPGTRIMHGQTATRRSDELNSNRTASAPTMPASRAAQSGCRKGLSLYRARVRRRTAPAAALATMSITAARCLTPKSTDRAAGPAAAASVNNQVGAGGGWEKTLVGGREEEAQD